MGALGWSSWLKARAPRLPQAAAAEALLLALGKHCLIFSPVLVVLHGCEQGVLKKLFMEDLWRLCMVRLRGFYEL